jgi:hypothetical protein
LKTETGLASGNKHLARAFQLSDRNGPAAPYLGMTLPNIEMPAWQLNGIRLD